MAEERPKTRGDCRDAVRPCPRVSCKHHLYLDVNPETGTITFNFPDLEPWELSNSCSLDITERGAITLEEVGVVMNLTRERIRQIECAGLLKLRAVSAKYDIQPDDYAKLVRLGLRRMAAGGVDK